MTARPAVVRRFTLSATFPIHVIGGWLENIRLIAQEQYLRVQEADFARLTEGGAQAARNPAQTAHEHAGETRAPDMPKTKKPPKSPGVATTGTICHGVKMGVAGLERVPDSPEKTQIAQPRAAESDALGARAAVAVAPADPDLACVIDAWDGLPAAIKAGILAMIASSAKGKE